MVTMVASNYALPRGYRALTECSCYHGNNVSRGQIVSWALGLWGLIAWRFWFKGLLSNIKTLPCCKHEGSTAIFSSVFNVRAVEQQQLHHIMVALHRGCSLGGCRATTASPRCGDYNGGGGGGADRVKCQLLY